MLTRNNVVWVIGMLAGGIIGMATHFELLSKLHLVDPRWQQWIELAAIFIGGGSAALRQSPLPHSDSNDRSVDFKRILINPPNETLPDFVGGAALPGPGPSSHSASR